MKVQLEIDETWALLSVIVKKIIDEVSLSEDDRSNLRRWRGEEMKTSSDGIRALLQKMNDDLERSQRNRQRSLIQRHDWV